MGSPGGTLAAGPRVQDARRSKMGLGLIGVWKFGKCRIIAPLERRRLVKGGQGSIVQDQFSAGFPGGVLGGQFQRIEEEKREQKAKEL